MLYPIAQKKEVVYIYIYIYSTFDCWERFGVYGFVGACVGFVFWLVSAFLIYLSVYVREKTIRKRIDSRFLVFILNAYNENTCL